MRFSQLYKSKSPVLSFEIFPPKELEKMPATIALIGELGEMQPELITVTYGAGGLSRDLSFELSEYIHKELRLRVCQHLTCVGHIEEEIEEIAQRLTQSGIDMVLALRGDPPAKETIVETYRSAFSSARELVKFLRAFPSLSLAVAGYPEMHRDAKSRKEEIEYLKEKVDAGGEVVYTQLFFDPDLYFRFVEDARAAGIAVPIVPGILPIGNISQLDRLTSLCGASIPKALRTQLDELKAKPEDVVQCGTDYAIQQIERLLAFGAPGIHLYTLNRAHQIRLIVHALGLGGYERISSTKPTFPKSLGDKRDS